MSWFSDIISGGSEGLLKGVGEAAKDIRAAITGKEVLDPNKQAEIEMKLVEIQNKAQEWDYLLAKAQTDINIEEAKSPNIWKSGWRPGAGWTCVLGLFWGTIGTNVFDWTVQLMGRTDIVAPKFDTASLIALLVPLLGLGVYRTTEKIKGTK